MWEALWIKREMSQGKQHEGEGCIVFLPRAQMCVVSLLLTLLRHRVISRGHDILGESSFLILSSLETLHICCLPFVSMTSPI